MNGLISPKHTERLFKTQPVQNNVEQLFFRVACQTHLFIYVPLGD